MPFTPEQPFQITEDNSLVYCLKFMGTYRKGKPVDGNDVAIEIDTPDYDNGGHRLELRAELARAICDFLNEKYPVKKD